MLPHVDIHLLKVLVVGIGILEEKEKEEREEMV